MVLGVWAALVPSTDRPRSFTERQIYLRVTSMRGTHAVERLELAIPEAQRPFDHAANRQALIRHWWPLERKSA
jgi:hypothetical protein